MSNGHQDKFSVEYGTYSEDGNLVLTRETVELTPVVLLQVLAGEIVMRRWRRYFGVLLERWDSLPVTADEHLIQYRTLRDTDVVTDC